jgi:YD repeat-containing protein
MSFWKQVPRDAVSPTGTDRWDGFGRLSTATDGAGDTITYTYDDADRITKVQYSDGTHEVEGQALGGQGRSCVERSSRWFLSRVL